MAPLCPGAGGRRTLVTSHAVQNTVRLSYDTSMKANILQAAMAATLALAWAAATHAQSTPASDTKTVIKEDAKTVGHAVAHSARTVGHEVKAKSRKVGHSIAERSRKAREAIRDDSKKTGHAVAHSATTVGTTVKDSAEKVETTVTRKSDEPQPKN